MNKKEQPILSDIISAIISSISKGRYIADLEAMRMAMQYEKIDLLNGLPVPRLRINSVQISMPVIMTGVTPGSNATLAPVSKIIENTLKSCKVELTSAEEWIQRGIGIRKLEENDDDEQLNLLKTYELIFKKVSDKKVDILSHFEVELHKRIENDIALLKTSMHDVISASAIVKQVGESTEKSLYIIFETAIFLHIKDLVASKNKNKGDGKIAFENERARSGVKELLDHKIIKDFVAKVRFATEISAIEQNDQPAEIQVMVDTENIKNAGGGPDAVTHLHFNVREEGLEWVTEISEEKSVRKLIPE